MAFERDWKSADFFRHDLNILVERWIVEAKLKSFSEY